MSGRSFWSSLAEGLGARTAWGQVPATVLCLGFCVRLLLLLCSATVGKRVVGRGGEEAQGEAGGSPGPGEQAKLWKKESTPSGASWAHTHSPFQGYPDP